MFKFLHFVNFLCEFVKEIDLSGVPSAYAKSGFMLDKAVEVISPWKHAFPPLRLSDGHSVHVPFVANVLGFGLIGKIGLLFLLRTWMISLQNVLLPNLADGA